MEINIKIAAHEFLYQCLELKDTNPSIIFAINPHLGNIERGDSLHPDAGFFFGKSPLPGNALPRIHRSCPLRLVVHSGRAPVISFCNKNFLAALPEIRRRTRRTVFVNCMTWLFGKEKEAMSRGDIALFLYQNDKVRQSVIRLRALKEIRASVS